MDSTLEQPGADQVYIDGPYQEKGFTISKLGGIGTTSLRYFQQNNSLYAGSAALDAVYGPGMMLDHVHGAAFNLISIDLSELNPDYLHERSVRFTGTKQDNSLVELEVTLDSVFGFETFVLPGFTDLIHVEWTGSQYQVDNLVITGVPEPSSLTLLLTGILILARWRGATLFTARRRAASH